MKKTTLSGKNYGYLGHFKKQKFLDQGHNDVSPHAQDLISRYGVEPSEPREGSRPPVRGRVANPNRLLKDNIRPGAGSRVDGVQPKPKPVAPIAGAFDPRLYGLKPTP